jgi:hypothetical protein
MVRVWFVSCPVLVLSLSVHATYLFALFRQFGVTAIATVPVVAVTTALSTSALVATRAAFNIMISLDTAVMLRRGHTPAKFKQTVALSSLDERRAAMGQNKSVGICLRRFSIGVP